MARRPNPVLSEYPTDLLRTDEWAPVDATLLGKLRRVYEIRQLAVQTYIRTGSLLLAAKLSGLANSTIVRLVRRCLTPLAGSYVQPQQEVSRDVRDTEKCTEGSIATPQSQMSAYAIVGWRGLIPNRRIRRGLRRVAARQPGKSGQKNNGGPGAMRALINFDSDIRAALITALLADDLPPGVSKLSPVLMSKLQRAFRNVCISKGMLPNQWPLNVKDHCRRSLHRWFLTDFLPEYRQRWVAKQHGRQASYRLNSTEHHEEQSPRFDRAIPMRTWEVDSHRIDGIATFYFQTPKGVEFMKLKRFWVLVARETGTGAVLAWLLIMREQVSQWDVLELLWRCVRPWRPREPVLGTVDYNPNAGFPNGSIPELAWALCAEIKMDNAWAHLAVSVRELALRILGASVNFGPGAHPNDRPHIERLFLDLASAAKREPDATGSHPRDTANRRLKADDHSFAVSQEQYEYKLDVWMANRNGTSSRSAGGRSALVRLGMELAAGTFAPNYLPADRRNSAFFGKREKRTIRGNIAEGRAPYLFWKGGEYTSPHLRQQWAEVGRAYWVAPDLEDCRHLYVFDEHGALVHRLAVRGRWARTPHSVLTRQHILRLERDGAIQRYSDESDPIEDALRYLVQSDDRNNVARMLGDISRIAPELATEALQRAHERLPTRVHVAASSLARLELKQEERQGERNERADPASLEGNRMRQVLETDDEDDSSSRGLVEHIARTTGPIRPWGKQ